MVQVNVIQILRWFESLNLFSPFAKEFWKNNYSSLTHEDLFYILLRDGIVFCKFMNIIVPQSIPYYHQDTNCSPFAALDNINQFLAICRFELDMDEEFLFDSVSFYTGKGDLEEVVETIFILSEFGERCGLTLKLSSIPADGGDDLLKELCRSNIYVSLFPYLAEKLDELSFEEGTLITVRKIVEGGWWEGEIDGQVGWFPANHVEVFDCENGNQPTMEDSLQLCITKLIESEMQFVSNMQSFNRRIVEPLMNETWFSMRDFELLFGSIAGLVEFHNSLLGELGNIYDGSDWIDYIVAVFANLLSAFVDLYAKYCGNSFARSRALEKLRRHETFCAFLKMAGFEMTPPTLHVHSYLQGPLQRIDTYLRFFKDLLEITEGRNLQLCHFLPVIERELREIKNLIKKSESQGLLHDLAKRIYRWSGADITNYGDIVMDGSLTLVEGSKKTKNVYLLLLERVLVCLRESGSSGGRHVNYELDLKIKVSRDSFAVEQLPDIGHRKYLIRISFLPRSEKDAMKKSYLHHVFSCHSEESKQQWLQAFERVLSNENSDDIYAGNSSLSPFEAIGTTNSPQSNNNGGNNNGGSSSSSSSTSSSESLEEVNLRSGDKKARDGKRKSSISRGLSQKLDRLKQKAESALMRFHQSFSGSSNTNCKGNSLGVSHGNGRNVGSGDSVKGMIGFVGPRHMGRSRLGYHRSGGNTSLLLDASSVGTTGTGESSTGSLGAIQNVPHLLSSKKYETSLSRLVGGRKRTMQELAKIMRRGHVAPAPPEIPPKDYNRKYSAFTVDNLNSPLNGNGNVENNAKLLKTPSGSINNNNFSSDLRSCSSAAFFNQNQTINASSSATSSSDAINNNDPTHSLCIKRYRELELRFQMAQDAIALMANEISILKKQLPVDNVTINDQ